MRPGVPILNYNCEGCGVLLAHKQTGQAKMFGKTNSKVGVFTISDTYLPFPKSRLVVPNHCTRPPACLPLPYDRIRESIMIWPVQDHNGGTHFYTVCPYKPRTRLNFLANCRQTSTLVSPLFRPGRKAVAAGADVLRQFAARRRVNEDSYGDVVRNLKG